MPSAVSPNPRTGSAGSDENRNTAQNYDDAVDEFLRDLPLGDGANNAVPPVKDIDEEITIKKKRKPVAKLDADRLLSQQGIPKLRKITKSRLKFRGKGYEFSDISKLLNTYQLWLDDLFPRAKFRDALAIVEKVGHSKRMQVTRKAWLDETKPHRRDASPEKADDDFLMSGTLPDDNGQAQQSSAAGGTDEEAVFGARNPDILSQGTGQGAAGSNGTPDDDELDALLAENESDASIKRAEPPKRRGPFDDESDEEDELDALLAEQQPESETTSQRVPGQSSSVETSVRRDEEFADEEEIITEMDLW